MKRIIAVIMVLGILFANVAVAETKTETYNAQVSGDVVVYATPWEDALSVTVGVINSGSMVTIVAETDDWYAIKIGEGYGFIRKSVWPTESEYPKEAVINGGKVWLRYEPSVDSKKDKVIYAGTIIEVSGDKVYNEDEDIYYYPIRYMAFDGVFVTRYVTAKYVEFTVD